MVENKCLDQGTVKLHGGEDEAGENILFWAPGATEPTPTVTRRCPSSLVSPVVAGTFPFDRKITRTSSLETKKRISKFHLQFAVYSGTAVLRSPVRHGIGPRIKRGLGIMVFSSMS